MRIVSARSLALACLAVVFMGVSAEALPVMSLKAVKRNGGAIAPTNSLTINPNDTVEMDVFLSAWAADLPLGVRSYNFKLDPVGFISPSVPLNNGNVYPLGWKAPSTTLTCSTDADCTNPLYPECVVPTTGCVQATHNPSLGVLIDFNRADYIFAGQSVTSDINTISLAYRYFGLMSDSIGITDSGTPKYLGTLKMQASNESCGTFTISLVLDDTFIADPQPSPVTATPIQQPLVLTVTNCNIQLRDCHPAVDPNATHCDIDARIPHNPLNAGARLTTDRIEMVYDRAATGTLTTDYELTLVGTGAVAPSGITSVSVSGNNVTVVLNSRIRHQNWTCLRDKRANRKCCAGVLSADSDWNRTSQVADVFELYDNLLGMVDPRLLPQQCDIDRSGLCAPPDLLMSVDLLLGADAFVDTSGDTLPPCPSPIP